jgi:hypothetical protein
MPEIEPVSSVSVSTAVGLGFVPEWAGSLLANYGPQVLDAALVAVRDHGFSVAAVTEFCEQLSPDWLVPAIHMLKDRFNVGAGLTEGVPVNFDLSSPLIQTFIKQVVAKYGMALLQKFGPQLLELLIGSLAK